MEVETEADKEFDSSIVGDILRQKFKQIRTNGSDIEINDWIESEVEMDAMAIQRSKRKSRRMKAWIEIRIKISITDGNVLNVVNELILGII